MGQVWLGTSEAPISDPAPVDLSRAVLPGALLVDERRVSSLIPGSEYLTFTSGARGKKNTNAFLHPARAKLQSSSSSNAAPLCKHTPQGTMPHGSSMQSCSRTSRMRSAGVTLLQLSPLQEVYVSTHQLVCPRHTQFCSSSNFLCLHLRAQLVPGRSANKIRCAVTATCVLADVITILPRVHNCT